MRWYQHSYNARPSHENLDYMSPIHGSLQEHRAQPFFHKVETNSDRLTELKSNDHQKGQGLNYNQQILIH